MRIAITGASGLVGRALRQRLASDGHTVLRLVRGDVSDPATEVAWDPAGGTIDSRGIEGLDAFVHLAGESVAGGRWTEARKARIRDSRVLGTQTIAEALARLTSPPSVLVSASAIGIYGDRGDRPLTEEDAPGTGFLADTARLWEGAAAPAAAAGIRTVFARFGIILSREGGALAKMVPPFKLGLGGRFGSGRQYWSWIALDDVVGAILHAVEQAHLEGPMNVTAPEPVTNAEFTRTLGRVLGRPTLFPLPAFAARLALGEMADEMLLASQRVFPTRLTTSGYSFAHVGLEGALRHALQPGDVKTT